MVVKGDLKCYHCGYVSAVVKGQDDQPLKEWSLQLSPICEPRKAWKSGRLHCCRCGGPLYMDEGDFLHPYGDRSPE